jgi:hypothetical protein
MSTLFVVGWMPPSQVPSATPMCLQIHLIDKTPNPILARLEGSDDRMTSIVEVLRGVLVLGIVTTTDMSAGQAKAQVNPGVAGLQALFTTGCVARDRLDLVPVRACFLLCSIEITHALFLLSEWCSRLATVLPQAGWLPGRWAILT